MNWNSQWLKTKTITIPKCSHKGNNGWKFPNENAVYVGACRDMTEADKKGIDIEISLLPDYFGEEGIYKVKIESLEGKLVKELVNFPIPDYSKPKYKDYLRLVDFINKQYNKRILIYCMGGHGRTGTILASLVHSFFKVKDPIKWIRENYCNKCVESSAQINFIFQEVMNTNVPKEYKKEERYYKFDWEQDLYSGF